MCCHCIITYSLGSNIVCLCLSEPSVQTDRKTLSLLLCKGQVYFGEGKLEHDAAVTVQ